MHTRDPQDRLPTEQIAKVFAALSDATRLRLVELLLAHGELSGMELAEKAGISPALTSHHRKILYEAGLVRRRDVGQTSYCSLNREVLGATFVSLLPELGPPAPDQ